MDRIRAYGIMWILVLCAEFLLGGANSFLRLSLFVFAICLAFCINKFYHARLKESAEQLYMQRLTAELAADFLTVRMSNIEEKVLTALEKAGNLFQVDRTYVLLLDKQGNVLRKAYEWCAPEIAPQKGKTIMLTANKFPWCMQRIAADGLVRISEVDRLPQEAWAEKEQLISRNVKSIILIHMAREGVQGLLCFDTIKSTREWNEEHVRFLELTANILGSAFLKVEEEKRQYYLAYYDQLTGLPNRTLFKDRLTQAILKADRTDKTFGVLFLDLDSFKKVNDTLGHSAGDQLLKILSQVLNKCVRKSDTVARLSGDEFLILANDLSNTKSIIKIADKILTKFSSPFKIAGEEFFITVSCGIAVYPDAGQDADTIIKNTDLAMYKAKKKGKNCYVLYSTDIRKEAVL